MNNADNKQYLEYLKSAKWRELAEQRMKIDDYKCAMCGCRGTAKNPLEVHHISYKHLYHEESRIYEDLVTLCHVCHKATHTLMERKTNADGRKGWKDSPRIPKVHAFNISGCLECKESKTNE